MAFSIGWTAISSELSRFAAAFGSNTLLLLCLSFYGASTGIQLAGAVVDDRVNALSGLHRAQLFRAVASFGGCAALLAALPHLQHSLPQLLTAVAGLGVLSGAAFGLSYQVGVFATRGQAGGRLGSGWVVRGELVVHAGAVDVGCSGTGTHHCRSSAPLPRDLVQLAAASPASGSATVSLNLGFVCSAPVSLAGGARAVCTVHCNCQC